MAKARKPGRNSPVRALEPSGEFCKRRSAPSGPRVGGRKKTAGSRVDADLPTCNPLQHETGDILAVRGTGWLSRQILAATGNTVSHVGLFIAAEPTPIVIEALTRVRTRPLDVSIAEAEHAWILNDSSLTGAQRDNIVRAALRFSADGYGYFDIALQGLDSLTHSTWWTDHLAVGLDYKPICSYLVAAAYETENRTFGQLDKTTTPADIYNFALAHSPNPYGVVPIK